MALGILLSRLMGLVRERVFAHYLGSSEAAGAFKAALRIPNVLQNLFGEGVLSASFIPVYAGALGRDDPKEARRVAGGIFGLLSLVVALLTAGGLLFSPQLVRVIAPGLEGETRELTVRLVRILFPGTGVLVLSAWCLGILNSHRRFFLSYAAPVVWNLAQIAVLLAFGGRTDAEGLVIALAFGTVAGGVLQFLVQLPQVLSLLGRFRPTFGRGVAGVRRVLSNFGPVVVGRGVVQLSAYVDVALASLLSARVIANLTYAQTLYLLPVSLFGMSVSAAELPEMSRAMGGELGEAGKAKLRERLAAGSARIAFFVIPSALAFLLLGDVVAATVLQGGAFDATASRQVWLLLIGSAVGLLASTLGRLQSSALYAMGDTRTPLAFAVIRVILGAGLAALAILVLLPDLEPDIRAMALPMASGLAAWVEYLLLRRSVAGRVGERPGAGWGRFRIFVAAAIAGMVGLLVKAFLAQRLGAVSFEGPLSEFLPAPRLHPVLNGALVLGAFGITYFACALWLKIGMAQQVVGGIARRLLRRGRG
ncbi:MAG TPA: murein biosynthesis integral membrane protein MurJ [Myxococcaceae bacterium]|nr:murein biosynthesis integral membrane protein MurJ [Myxococcaceae bacterium]